MDSPTLVLFGDGSSNFSSQLEAILLKRALSSWQSEFIRQVDAALAVHFQHINLPSSSIRIHDLAILYQKTNGACHPAVSSVLLCLVQLLQIFQHYESSPHGAQSHSYSQTVAAGFCTGSLAAAAFTASSSLNDLRRLAVPVLLMACQMGVEAASASSMLYEQDDNELQSWSFVVPRMAESEALSILAVDAAADRENAACTPQKCFLSAVGTSSVTISGPPPALRRCAERVRDSSLCSSSKKSITIPIPIFAGYHAEHIHGMLDFDTYLARCGVGKEFLASFNPAPGKRLLSPASGTVIECESALGLFETVVLETLQGPLRLDRIVDGYSELIQIEDTSSSSGLGSVPDLVVNVIQPNPAAEGLASALGSRHSVIVSLRNLAFPSPSPDAGVPSTEPGQEPLAIIGMAGRFPGAGSVEALWGVLEAGLDLHRTIPPDRFNITTHVDPTLKTKNTTATPYGCFIDRPGEFDPRFFNMSPREALQTDPMQRLALVTAYEALEMAGFVAGRTRSSDPARVGTFYGQTSDDYRDVNAAQEIGTYFITGGIRAFGPGRINYFFKFGGPSFNIDTACSSGLAAIQIACSSLWAGDCDTAVAGGLSILSSPDLYSGLSRGQFLSTTGSCKTFDDSADGYCRADGVGSIVIKRLSDAVADHDHVLGVVRGAATNHSCQAISLTHPHAETQARLYRDVLGRAGREPSDVGYVEMHGTGTQAGDGMEMRSVMEMFAPEGEGSARVGNPLVVGALKANIGHGEAAAGVSSLIKALLVLQKEAIPQHVGIKTELNKRFPDLGQRNVHIPLSMTPFPRKVGKTRSILVNNFGAAGGNTALLLEEAPAISSTSTPTSTQSIPLRPSHPVTISGHTPSALQNNLQRLVAYLRSNPQISPADLSYTTTARRRHHALRVTVTGSSIPTILTSLEQKMQCLNADPARSPRPSPSPSPDSIVFVFTGQGATYPALASELYKTSTPFRSDIDSFNTLATQQGFPPFLSLIDGPPGSTLDELSPAQIQLGLVCIQIALARLWVSWGIRPAAVIGHSLGEYAALQASGVLSVGDVIYLVGSRAALLEKKCKIHSHAMLAVKETAAALQGLIAEELALERVEVACLNSPQETVLAGPEEDIYGVAGRLEARGVRCKKVTVPYAFHSAQVESVLGEFERLAGQIQMRKPRIPILSSLRGEVLLPPKTETETKELINARYLGEHCRQPVLFFAAIQHAQTTIFSSSSPSPPVFLEIGPHPICSGMIRRTLQSDNGNRGKTPITLATLKRDESPWSVMTASLASLHDLGITINWNKFHREIDRRGECRLLTDLPSYAFDSKDYWIPYRNDWTLRKGDPPLTTETKPTSPQAKGVRPRISASVHRVVEETYSGSSLMAVFESDLWAPEIHAAIRGHLVNGSGLCPASLYADIALTIARHVQQHPDSGFALSGHDVTAMEVHQGLIVNSSIETETRVLRVKADLDPACQTIKLEYLSCNPKSRHDEASETLTSHATCTVGFGSSESWLRKWRRDLYLIQDRILSLQNKADVGAIDRVTTGLAYRLFSALVDYVPAYQRMRTILFDAARLEAVATVLLDGDGCGTDSDCSGFLYSPYWIDSLIHITGFVMNASPSLDANEVVYIAHGWESLRFAGRLDPSHGQTYQSYVRMQPDGENKNMAVGDVWVLCEGDVVALAEGVRFQRVPRKVLELLLPSAEKENSGNNKAKAISKEHTSCRSRGRPQRDIQDKHNVLEIIASELSIPASDLSPSDQLASLGVDSLMSLTLAGRLLETFDITIFNTEFADCATLGELLNSVCKRLDEPGLRSGSQHGYDSSTTASASPPSQSTGSPGLGPGIMTPARTSTSISTESNAVKKVKSILAEETGIALDEISHAESLTNFGVDSLMSLVILGRLRDEGVDLPAAFFSDHQTMNDIEGALNNVQPQPSASRQDEMAQKRPRPSLADQFPSRLVLLQKRTNPASTQNLYLFPIGSGSPSLYNWYSQFSPEFDAYGLVSPFVNCPQHYTCTFTELVSIYLVAIRQHQPHGPYHFGGQVIEAGEEAASLLLIDSPCPVVLPPMTTALIDYCFDLKFLVDDPLASEERVRLMREHRHANVRNLASYAPVPRIPAGLACKAPQTVIIWAEDGARDATRHPEPPFTYDWNDRGSIERWVLEDRTEFGPYGWDELIPEEKIEIFRTEGNHYQFDKPPGGPRLCKYLQDFMARFHTCS
ncbi:uncharacterized protein BDV17DRAFT_300198 [Aspergillus undulatus]|uniref:uncharacterized protein n=1 Tax=Aspergillus undulatus TaxID=1810928 RepID=UPI003CCD97FA